MQSINTYSFATFTRDLNAGIVLFFVALPLCLGIALASNAPLLSGILSGIVGGIVVGLISRSHTSVSGPAAGLAAIVASQLAALDSFPAFLFAVVLAGILQIVLGITRVGFIAEFFPTSVIKGLLAAIGLLLILKQIPHLLGHDADPQGDMAFQQPDQANTFTELSKMLGHVHLGATIIGLVSIGLLVGWSKFKMLKSSTIPAPLAVVLLGVLLGWIFRRLGGIWNVEPTNFVQVPVAKGVEGLMGFLQFPDFSQWTNPAVYVAGITIAIVASLETLLNLEAIDKIDPKQRTSPPNRELISQGIGNMAVGLIGGIPITSVIIRSSVNINAGGQTKLATIWHGLFLFVCVAFFPLWLNRIPLSCLAAILFVTGIKLASPQLVKQMWSQGRYQFMPFALTVIAIVFTDLLIGISIGLVLSLGFVLNSNLRRPIRRILEKHVGGDVLRIELANQVSFFNRAALNRVLDEIPNGGHVLIDARNSDYIDPDLLDLIRDFQNQRGPVRNVQVSLMGFKSKYLLEDRIQFVDYSTRELQSQLSPQQVLQILQDGHARFRSGQRLTRNLGRQVRNTASSQHPLAVVLSCIDSRAPTEIIFDLGLGDILSIRIAGNITSRKVLGSMEYACVVAGAKLIVVMGHTRCGAIGSAIDLFCQDQTANQSRGSTHLDSIVEVIKASIDPTTCGRFKDLNPDEKEEFKNTTARRNVSRVTETILSESPTLNNMHQKGEIAIIGAVYDVTNGNIDFLQHEDACVRAISD